MFLGKGTISVIIQHSIFKKGFFIFKEYDKLYVDNKIYEWNEVLGQVVEHTENQRFGGDLLFSRPGTQLGGIFGGSGPFGGQGYANSRPPSGMSMRWVDKSN